MLHYGLLRSLVYILSLSVVLVGCQKNDITESTDYISSVANRLKLLKQNEKLLLNFYEYIDELQEKIETLQRLAKHLHQPQLAAKGQEEEFLSNPMNSLSLIRQMHADWTHVEKLMDQPVGQRQLNFIRKRPKLKNVKETFIAMYRIASSYELNATDIAKGLLDGMQTDAKLSPLECYEMGFLYFNGSLYHRAVEWLETAKELMDKTPSDVYALLGLTRSKISHLLARCYTALDNLELARLVLQSEPDFNAKAEQLLEYFQANKPQKVENDLIEFYSAYAYFCGSSYKPEPTRLLCSYKTSGTPFLRLAPFQMEQISIDPDIFVFHNVISSAEIAILDRETEAFLVPAKVGNSEGEKVTNYRTVNSAWLPDINASREVNLLAVRLHKRMSDLSDFNLDSYSDVMQVLKYDFGGHFNIHNDFFNDSSSEDRIATILLYLNDVPSGGGTVFFDLDLTVQPEPGKAVLWYNLNLETFDYEERNIHASCPVKIGSKFAITQWVFEHRQMFNRPCLRPPKFRQYK